MPYRSNLLNVDRTIQEATEDGLIAAANVIRNAVIMRLRGGYTSGDYVTGTSIRAVTVTPVFTLGGVPSIRVGTDLMYNLYWELGWRPASGHYVLNPETWKNVLIQASGPRRVMRVEIWRPAFQETQTGQQRAFARAFQRRMSKR